jgi:hypothetical protein
MGIISKILSALGLKKSEPDPELKAHIPTHERSYAIEQEKSPTDTAVEKDEVFEEMERVKKPAKKVEPKKQKVVQSEAKVKKSAKIPAKVSKSYVGKKKQPK